jgi:hypothetical protein
MADQDVDKFFEETVERSLRDYAEEGVTTDSDPAAITQYASSKAAASPDSEPDRTSWGAIALGSAIAIALLILLGIALGLLRLP